jgi:microcystin degradation protein MlrC
MTRRSLASLVLVTGLWVVAGCSAGEAVPREDQRPRLAVGGLRAESNAFYPALSEMRPQERVARDQRLQATGGVRGGLAEAAERLGLDIYPIHTANASFLGTVSDASFNASVDALIRDLTTANPRFDGVFLDLHGAMVVESYPSGDAEIVRRVREAMGPGFPIIVTNDFHGNVTPEGVRNSTVWITYKESPHLDTKERGIQAAEIMAEVLAGRVRPVQAVRKPPILVNLMNHDTFEGPLKPIVAESRRLEAENPRILAVSVPGGYHWADVEWMGPSVIVATDNDPELAEREAERLAGMLWDIRDDLTTLANATETDVAVRRATASQGFPVVLMDTGDNIGGGSAGDGTFLLAEFLRQNAVGWAMSISDPEAVGVAARAGVGQPFDLAVGGKRDNLHGDPVRVRGRVKSVSESSAVIEVDGGNADFRNYLVLTNSPSGARNVDEYVRNGIDPSRQKMLVAKGVVAPLASYREVASEVIMVTTPGPTSVNPAHFTYRNVRRPYYGLDR